MCRGRKILICLCIALIYLHANYIAHRDVKSANVLIAQDGLVRLADFGQAWKTGSEDLHAESGTGTEGWAPPEQRNRQPLTVKTDMWSFGVVCVEVILLCCHRKAVALAMSFSFVFSLSEHTLSKMSILH